MTTKRSSAIRLLCVLLCSFGSFAPISSQIDTEFWCSVPYITADSCEINAWLNIARMGANTIPEIRLPALNNLLANTLDPWMYQYTDGYTHLSHGISTDAENMFSEDYFTYYPNILCKYDTITNCGIYIHANEIVQAQQVMTARNSDNSTMKGRKALGKRFLVPWQNLFPNSAAFPNARNSVQVVATEDNTTVTITPSADLYGGHPAGIPFSVQLNRGQVYCFAAALQSAAGHLGGSEILADNPVAIDVADNAVTPDGSSFDLLMEQMLPEEYADREYVVIPAPAANLFATTAPLEEYAFIYAIENNTEIEILHGNQTLTVSLDRGDCHTYVFSDRSPIHILADKPVFVFQVSGFGGDLCGTLLSPWQCRGIQELEYKVMHKAYGDNTPVRKHLIFTFICEENARNGFETHLYHIDNWDRPRCITFTLNPDNWSEIPGTDLWYCIKDITSNSVYNDIWKCIHVTNDDGPFQATVMEYDMPTLSSVKGTSAVHYADFDIACKLHFDTTAMRNEYCEGEDILFLFDTAKITNLQVFAPDHTPVNGSSLSNVTLDQSGFYYAIGYDASGCRAEPFNDSIYLNIIPAITVYLEDSVCVGQAYSRFGFHFPADSLSQAGTRTDTLTVSAVNGCDSILILQLNIRRLDVEITTSGNDFCDFGDLVLTAVSTATNYLWNTGETTPFVSANHSGQYSVTASDGECQATAFVEMPTCEFNLYLPNAITPSKSDGLNDCLSIPASAQRSITDFDIEIRNRWGEIIYKTNDKSFRWCGDNANPDNVYPYIIRMRIDNGKPLIFRGEITVL